MTIWMDLTNSLEINKGNVVGIIRSELMQARLLHDLDKNIRYSVLTKWGFKEVPAYKLRWLFKADNIGDEYLKYQLCKKNFLNRLLASISNKLEKRIYKRLRRKRDKSIPKSEFLTYPYSDGDVIYSCGWFGTSKEDFFHRVKNFLPNLKIVYTIYDLVMVKDNIRHMYYPNDMLFDGYMSWISNNCDGVVYCGHTAQVDAEEYFKKWNLSVPEGHWIKYGGDFTVPDCSGLKQKVLDKYNIKNPYVLAVGSFDHKKNYRVLYQAFCQLQLRNAKNIPDLVIIGRKLANNELQEKMLQNPLIKDKVKCFSCTDEELNVLYKNCEFALLSSLYEGYSVVLLETLGYGKFCICSDVQPLREVGGNFVTYVNPHHPKEWADCIEKYANDHKLLSSKEAYIQKHWRPVSWLESTKDLYGYLKSFCVKNTGQKVYVDVGLLLYQGGLSGIPRAELLIARYLGQERDDIHFFFLSKGYYHEFSRSQIKNLLSDEDIDVAVQNDRDAYRGSVAQCIPFKKGDVVFSAGVGYDEKTNAILKDLHKEREFIYVQVLYDFSPITVPHTHPKVRVEQYPSFLNTSYELSDFIIYGGKTAQQDGADYQKNLGIKPKSSYAVKFGSNIVAKSFTNEYKREVLEKFGITGDFLLSVGTIEARKNHEVLYEAYLELLSIYKDPSKLPQIVICGHPGWKTDGFRHLIQVDNRTRGRVILITPSDEELNVLYTCCKFTLLASVYEGWSLTLPESLNYGKFCLCADVKPLKEIGQSLVDYVNPYDPVEWADKIYFYYKHPKELRNKEKSIAKNWHNTTWRECADNINTQIDMLLKRGVQ